MGSHRLSVACGQEPTFVNHPGGEGEGSSDTPKSGVGHFPFIGGKPAIPSKAKVYKSEDVQKTDSGVGAEPKT
jgi:hypothetical protein